MQMDAERQRKQLYAGISHDLRTPLTAIKGYVEGLRDGVASTPEMRENTCAPSTKRPVIWITWWTVCSYSPGWTPVSSPSNLKTSPSKISKGVFDAAA